MPPTLKALLAARLDQLDEAERRVLERGSVEGEIFHRGAVQALAPEETQVTTRLAALVRHQLIRPDRAQLAGDDGYRFRHLLIRDAAYDALPKAVRADLHARFADWLDEHGQALVERDEIVGYHLEQAARYQAELGQPDPSSPNVPPPGSRPPADARSTARTTGSACAARPGGRARPTASARPRARARGRMGVVATSDRARRRTLRRPRPNVPRPRATAPGRCSHVRGALALGTVDRRARCDRRAWSSSAARASPRGGAGRPTPARAALGRCSPIAANFRMQNDDDVDAADRLSATTASPATRPVASAWTGR